jgi:hypothetical protein
MDVTAVAVVATYVKEYVVPDITVATTPKGAVGIATPEDKLVTALLSSRDVVVLLLKVKEGALDGALGTLRRPGNGTGFEVTLALSRKLALCLPGVGSVPGKAKASVGLRNDCERRRRRKPNKLIEHIMLPGW